MCASLRLKALNGLFRTAGTRGYNLARWEGLAEESLAELVRLGARATPALLEALERRGDAELRRRAHLVLQHIHGDQTAFDAYGPEGLRHEQITVLRERLLRRAG